MSSLVSDPLRPTLPWPSCTSPGGLTGPWTSRPSIGPPRSSQVTVGIPKPGHSWYVNHHYPYPTYAHPHRGTGRGVIDLLGPFHEIKRPRNKVEDTLPLV